MTAMIRIMILGLLAVTLTCTSCGGDTAASQSASDLLSPSPVADEDLSGGIAFEGQTADEDSLGSAMSN